MRKSSNSIDPPVGLTVVQTDTNSFGSISLSTDSNNYFLYAAGATDGPELQLGGTAVTAGEIPGWSPIGAVATSTGYEVAWKLNGGNEFVIWNTDANGNYVVNGPLLLGTSTALETAETTFNQDLNGDGTIGAS